VSWAAEAGRVARRRARRGRPTSKARDEAEGEEVKKATLGVLSIVVSCLTISEAPFACIYIYLCNVFNFYFELLYNQYTILELGMSSVYVDL
jgi:hypothetical protein